MIMMMIMHLAAVLCFAVTCGLLVAVYRKLEYLTDCLDCLLDLEGEPGRQREEEMDSASDPLKMQHCLGAMQKQLLERDYDMERMHRIIQSLKRHLGSARNTLEEGLEMCRSYASKTEWVWNDAAADEKTLKLPERTNEESLFVEETGYEEMELKSQFGKEMEEEEEGARNIGTCLQPDEQQLAEKVHLKEITVPTERRDEDESKPESPFLQWLFEKRGVLARELEQELRGKKRSIEKESEAAVDCGFELIPELIGAPGLKRELSSQTEDLKRRNECSQYASIDEEMAVDNLEAREEEQVRLEELVAAGEGRLGAPLQVASGLPDRSRGLGTEETLDLQKKVRDLKRRIQCLGDLIASQEIRLKEEKAKNENFENLIVELGGESEWLHYQVAIREAIIVELKNKNAILCEEALALRDKAAELEAANVLKGDWQPFIWALPLACFMLLWKSLPFFIRLNCGGDELGEGGDELTRIS
ncbi:uncharacterized protein [Macrobrachium rosenbergii]|uniref:uncharacterized protein n=1 Tax=Macrobrachium rosenbergii TaxID=79674 RepID=UPI0034D4AC57